MAKITSPTDGFVSGNKPALLSESARTALDFWKWSYSDLMQNITRGYVAQYIIAWALGIEDKPNEPWRSFDLLSPDGRKIEVKSTAFLQAWTYTLAPNPLFALTRKLPWTDTEGMGKEAAWNADVYVLSFFYWKDRETANVMNLDQWRFWVLKRDEVVALLDGRKSLSVAYLEKNKIPSLLASELKNAILAIDQRPEIRASKPEPVATGKLYEKSFFDRASNNLDKDQLNGLWQVYNYCNLIGEIEWGTNSFSSIFPAIIERSLFSIYSSGAIQLYYGFLPDPKKNLFISELAQIKQIANVISDKKGSPMCKDVDWLESPDSFIQAIEKIIANSYR